MPPKKKTQKPPTSTSDDPTTAYAVAVVSGEIVAGPHVRAACQRHLDDLRDGPARGLSWDPASAGRVFGFFENVLKLKAGQFEGKPFILQPWQHFVVGSLFGWKGADGFRRFRTAYIEAGKGCGKSPLAGGIGLYMMMADGEPGAEIYAAAADREQAGILFKDAISMARQSPAISKRVSFSGGAGREWNIAYLDKGSFFRPISSESSGRGKSGYRPHCVLLDEIYEHPTAAMVEFMSMGIKARRQPLIFMITNSGSDRQSVCWDYHDYGVKVAAGDIADDRFFPYICALDEKDDPFKDEACWQKTNPSLVVTPGYDYVRGQVHQARGMPSKQNKVLRLVFCVWTDADTAWIGREAWEACEVESLDMAALSELPCYGGLDLSAKLDLTSGTRVWRDIEEDRYYAVVEYWTPAETLGEREDKDRVPYRLWRDEGHLMTTPGRAVDYGFVVQRLGDQHADCEFVELAYDRWRIDHFRKELEDAGLDLPLVEFGQGFKDMAPAIDALEEAIINGKLFVQFNPVLRWNVASAVVEEDPAGNRKFTKRKATGRIDGLITLAMAVARAAQSEGPRQSIYEKQGIEFW